VISKEVAHPGVGQRDRLRHRPAHQRRPHPERRCVPPLPARRTGAVRALPAPDGRPLGARPSRLSVPPRRHHREPATSTQS
jgi:hypothetical protein